MGFFIVIFFGCALTVGVVLAPDEPSAPRCILSGLCGMVMSAAIAYIALTLRWPAAMSFWPWVMTGWYLFLCILYGLLVGTATATVSFLIGLRRENKREMSGDAAEAEALPPQVKPFDTPAWSRRRKLLERGDE